MWDAWPAGEHGDSSLTPSQETIFLGIAMNSLSMTAWPSPQWIDSMLSMLLEIRPDVALPLVWYRRLLGMLTLGFTG